METNLTVDFRQSFIDCIISKLEDKAFMEQSRVSDQGTAFSRRRKISFIHLIVLLTQSLSRSIQRELNSFYQKLLHSDFSLQHITKGAFSRARSKLKAEAFIQLNHSGVQDFYQHAPYRRFQGFRLLAIDGSTACLPHHKSITQEFGTPGFGPYRDSDRSVARLSVLYDVLNFVVLDGQIDRYQISEKQLARRHLQPITPDEDLVLLDRYYPSLLFLAELKQKGIDFIIRMRVDWWLQVREMLDKGQSDEQVIFEVPRSTELLCLRLVALPLGDGQTEVLCTSVLDHKRLPYECFYQLYHYRWNIEEGYKLFKCRLQLEAFSGKTALAVKQDFFAKLFMMTTTAVLAFPVEEKLKKEQSIHPHQVNRTNALSQVKELFIRIFLDKLIQPALAALDHILTLTKEIVRKNRSFPRKKLKKKPPSMNYKQL
jgi:Transposase DDE domain